MKSLRKRAIEKAERKCNHLRSVDVDNEDNSKHLVDDKGIKRTFQFDY